MPRARSCEAIVHPGSTTRVACSGRSLRLDRVRHLLPGRLDRLGAFYPTPGYCDEEMNFFRASELREPGESDAAAQPDEDEDIEIMPFPVDELRSMIRSGEIIDLKTVAALTWL